MATTTATTATTDTMATTTATTATTATITSTTYLRLGNEIAEAHERLVEEARERGSPRSKYVTTHGPHALPADWLGFQAPACVLNRARVRAQALIRKASEERSHQGLVRAPMGHREARARVMAITAAGPRPVRQKRRFTSAEVRFIRREYRPGRGSPASAYGLGQLFGVSPGVIYQIVNRQTYADVPDED